MRIKNILRESLRDILIEAMDINSINQKYYPKINNNDFLSIINADPTYDSNLHPDKMGIYGKWLLNQYQKKHLKLEDLYKIKKDLEIFNKYRSKIENKDINSYDVNGLYNTIKPFQENPNIKATHAEEIREIKSGAEKVYEDSQWLVIVPHTKESSCYYGKGTRWCTAADVSNNRFDDYNSQGKLYINIDKVNNRKYQFHFETNSFMDEEDIEIETPVYETVGLSNGLLEYYKKKYPNEWFKMKYDFIRDFNEGLAGVILNGKWGFIDKKGNVVIPIKYDDTWGFDEGLASVELNDKWGFINKKGDEVISTKYSWATFFYNGLAQVKLNNKWGFIDKHGNEVIPVKYDWIEGFNDGLAMAKINDKWGFIDKHGNEVIPIKYDWIKKLENGLVIAKINDKYGIIDKQGNWYNSRKEYENKVGNKMIGENTNKKINKRNRKIKFTEQQLSSIRKKINEEDSSVNINISKNDIKASGGSVDSAINKVKQSNSTIANDPKTNFIVQQNESVVFTKKMIEENRVRYSIENGKKISKKDLNKLLNF